jgi:predicted DNA-binding transcriptional regulator AlpA
MASLVSNSEGTNHPRIIRLKVMRRLGCSCSTVYRLVKSGVLPQAERLENCSSAGWHEDTVDSVVESLRPAGKKPVMPAVTVPAKSTHAGTQKGDEAGVATVSLRMQPYSGISKPASDLLPTTLRIMGNVVYLHAPTGKLLMDIGNLSAPGRGVKLDLCAIVATGYEAEESVEFHTSASRKKREISGPHGRGNLRS